MARYIDAELIDFSCLKNEFDKARAKVIIMGQPTADVAPIADTVRKMQERFDAHIVEEYQTIEGTYLIRLDIARDQIAKEMLEGK